jgi:hypothetical protein
LYLARQRYRPDIIGWLEAFSYAHTNGTRTTADGVHRLRPATHLTITPHGMNERQHWRLEHRPDPGLDPVKHSPEVFEAFRERRTQGTPRRQGVLALSVGLDSRLVAAALPRDADFKAFTFVDLRSAPCRPTRPPLFALRSACAITLRNCRTGSPTPPMSRAGAATDIEPALALGHLPDPVLER